MKIVNILMEQTFAMGETVEIVLQNNKKGTTYFFVVGGKNGEINDVLDHRFTIGTASLVDYNKGTGYFDKRVVVSDPDNDGITESVMTNAFEPQQTIIMLEGMLNGSAEQYMAKLKEEYENKARVRLAYKGVEEDFYVEGRIVDEKNGILRVKNPIHFDFYGDVDIPDIIPFKTGFVKRDGLVISKGLVDLSEIELELMGNYELNPEERIEKKHSSCRGKGHLKLVQ